MLNSLKHYTHLRGIEREALRLNQNGLIAQSMHPVALGAKLTNSSITVDFSESLLELITPPSDSIEQVFQNLDALSAFCAKQIAEDEYLLNASMPVSASETAIRIADFGTSNSGRMKAIYRKGLAARYGKIMQAIAGVHYNFSFDPALLKCLSKTRQVSENALYFSVINHYFELMWLIPFLFGASPICAKTSVKDRPDYLTSLDETHDIGQYATSLRMSDLGYQSPAQRNLYISYRDVKSYVHDLVKATETPYPAFARLGLYDKQHQRQQLNTGILQIENEYYSSIRPKQVAERGERPACALLKNGVRYLEVRLLDINPFARVGIDVQTSYFIEALLTSCLLKPLKAYDKTALMRQKGNLKTVIQFGRKPALKLIDRDGRLRALKEIGHWHFDHIEETAFEMGKQYLEAVQKERKKLDDVTKTPSAQVIAEALKSDYLSWNLENSKKMHRQLQAYALPEKVLKRLTAEVQKSLEAQKVLEKSQCSDLNSYIENYYRSAGCC